MQAPSRVNRERTCARVPTAGHQLKHSISAAGARSKYSRPEITQAFAGSPVLDEAGRKRAPTSCTLVQRCFSSSAAAFRAWAVELLALLLAAALVGSHAATCRSGVGGGGGGSGAVAGAAGFCFGLGFSIESRTTLLVTLPSSAVTTTAWLLAADRGAAWATICIITLV